MEKRTMAAPLIVAGVAGYEIHKHAAAKKKQAAEAAAAQEQKAAGPPAAEPGAVSTSGTQVQVQDSKDKLQQAIKGPSTDSAPPTENKAEKAGEKVQESAGKAASATKHFVGGLFHKHQADPAPATAAPPTAAPQAPAAQPPPA
jgi:hypothetical protein